jgi:hypothetical protein
MASSRMKDDLAVGPTCAVGPSVDYMYFRTWPLAAPRIPSLAPSARLQGGSSGPASTPGGTRTAVTVVWGAP